MRGWLGSVRALPAWLRGRGARKPARKGPPFRRKLLFEALEPRVLLSADLNPLAEHALLGPAIQQAIPPQSQTPNMAAVLAQQPAQRAIVFLDASLEQYRAELGDANVILLDPERDGVAQITETLTNERDVGAVHIVTHGDPSGALLGDAKLGGSTIESYADSLATWRDALTADADILIYGCSVGADSAFTARLSELTGADVAASTNETGSAALGGDWKLEASTGPIEAAALALQSYDGLLVDKTATNPAGETLEGTAGADKLTGFTGRDVLKGLAGDERRHRDGRDAPHGLCAELGAA